MVKAFYDGKKLICGRTFLKRYGAWAAFFIAFFPRLIFIFTSTYPVSIGGDELFQFMPIAKLVGWDWSGMAGDYRYYGYGFFVLLTPLFKIISNPLILYRSIVFILAVLQALIAPLAYRIMRDMYQIENGWFLLMGAEVCSYFVTVRAVYTYNEHPYIFIVWLLAAALLKLECNVDFAKGKRKWTLIVMLLLIYALTLHSRAVTLWIAAAAGIVIYYIAYRKWVISWGILGGLGIVGYIGTEWIKRLVIVACMAQNEKAIQNVSVSFDISGIFESGKAVLGWFYIIIGQLSTLMIFSGGFAVFCLVVCVYKLMGTFFKKMLPRRELSRRCQMDSKSFFLMTIMLAAVAITILGQSFSWLGDVVVGLENNRVVDGFRAFTYLRYFGAYFGPILMMGLVWLIRERETYCSCIGVILSIGWTLQLIWCTYILPYISSFNGTVWDYAPYSMTHGWTDELSRGSYMMATLLVIVSSYIFCFLIKKNKVIILTAMLACLLMYEYGYNAVYGEGWRGKTNYEAINDSCQVIDALSEKGVLPDKIYVENRPHPITRQGIGCLYQFMLPEQKIMAGWPVEDEKEPSAVLTLDGNLNEGLVDRGYWFVWLGESQYIYVKGEELQQALQELGMIRLD